MHSNLHLFQTLLSDGHIDLQHGRLLDTLPPPLPAGLDWDRIDGMMLGLAIGDALGRPTEAYTPERRAAEHGAVRDYLSYGPHDEIGLPSDDTQLAFWTLDQLLLDDGLDPDHLAHRFGGEQIIGFGRSLCEALVRLELAGVPWYECGSKAPSNGALMRIAPVLVPYVRSPSPGLDLRADAVFAAFITHNDPTSTASCLAFSAMLWELLGMSRPPDPQWWPNRFTELAADLEGETHLRLRGGGLSHFDGPLWRFVHQRVAPAYDLGLTSLESCETWGSGGYLLETVPCVLSILMRHAADPEEAIVRAVNDTCDNDTIAAIVGAAVGALHGARRLPERWLRGLKGRTRANDDGEVQRILARARVRWA